MDSKQRGDGYISSDDGFSSLVEKALLYTELEDNVSCDNVASRTVCEEIDPREVEETRDSDTISADDLPEYGSSSSSRDTESLQSDYRQHQPDGIISPSTLCDEARKKTSNDLPMDNTVNLSSSSTSTSVSDGIDEGMYVVTKLKEMPKLHRAVWRGDLVKVKSIGNGIRKTVLNARDKEQRTALHLACAKGAKEIVNFLCGQLRSIIDVNLQDLNGCTPIHKLIDNGHGCDGSLELLLECGGNLNIPNNFGHTPLHIAARRGDAVTASFLMFKGASVHSMDQVGRTPLHLAALNNSEEAIANLIMYGADIRSKDKMGRTPLMVAKKEALAKFMYDLTCDQESKEILMTEADYSAACAVKEEITTLQPPCKEETRAQLLNEWNSLNHDEDEGDHLEHSNSAEERISDHTISDHTIAADGNDSSDEGSEYDDCFTPTHQEMKDSSKDVCAGTSGEVDIVNTENWNVSRKMKTRSSSSKEYLNRYYSVASVFKCEHFKSMDTQLGCNSNHSNDYTCTSDPLFCHSSCFCSAASHLDSSTMSQSSTTENPASTYSQLSLSSSSHSIGEDRANHDITQDSDGSRPNNKSVDSVGTVLFTSSESRDVGGSIKPANSNESRVASDVTVTESSEEFFTDALDGFNECSNNNMCEKVNSSHSLLKRSSSTSELISRRHSRFHSSEDVMKRSSTCEVVSHTQQLTHGIKTLRQKLLKNYEGKSAPKESCQDEVTSLVEFQKLAQMREDGTRLRQELLSSQMLNSSQENTIRQLKLQVKMKQQEIALQRDKQNQIVKDHREKLNHSEQENQALLWQLEENCEAKKVLLQKLEGNVQAKQDLVQELEDAYGANQELLLTLKDADENKEQMLAQIYKAKAAVRDLWEKLKSANAVKESMQRKLDNTVSAESIREEIFKKLLNVDVCKMETYQKLKDIIISQSKLAHKELQEKLKVAEMERDKKSKDLDGASIARGKLCTELVCTRSALDELAMKFVVADRFHKKELKEIEAKNQKLLQAAEEAQLNATNLGEKLVDANATSSELRTEIEDAAIAKMEFFQDIEGARCEIEDLKQKVNRTNASKEDLIQEIEKAAVAKMKMFQELENARSANEELVQVLQDTNDDKKKILKEVEATKINNDNLKKQLKETYTVRQELLQQVKDVVTTRKDLLKKVDLAKRTTDGLHLDFRDDAEIPTENVVSEGNEIPVVDGEYVTDEQTVQDNKYKKEVVELTATLESMNCELLEMIRDSEQRVKEEQQLKEKWLQEKNDMASLLTQLQSSVEREAQEKELIIQENDRLRAHMKKSIEALEHKYQELEEQKTKQNSENLKVKSSQLSRINFLEAKVFMLESALQSTQCMAREYSLQSEALRQRCTEQEAALLRTKSKANETETEAKNTEDLESVLEMCKRRIAEQNGNNTKLLEQINSLQSIPPKQDIAGCSTCSMKIKSLEQNLSVLGKEVEYSKKTCILLEGSGKSAKSEMNKVYAEIGKIQASVEQMSTMRDHWEKDAAEARKIMKEQLRFKDETIVAYMKKIKRLKEMNSTSASDSTKDSI